uniref:Secreted protein n=1 Tax=Heterorhabditis bacteriophora TaxID=37862 RepID=A0A1I7W985_HETBA
MQFVLFCLGLLLYHMHSFNVCSSFSTLNSSLYREAFLQAFVLDPQYWWMCVLKSSGRPSKFDFYESSKISLLINYLEFSPMGLRFPGRIFGTEKRQKNKMCYHFETHCRII